MLTDLRQHRRQSEILYLGCDSCALLPECGGLDDLTLWGCFQKCLTCDVERCDWTCPKNRNQFWSRFREVGGWPPKPLQNIRTAENLYLPLYLPQIHNGHDRRNRLAEPIVAVPTFSILKGRPSGSYGPIASDRVAFRRALKLSGTTKILLVSVAQDWHLERFWRFAESCDVGPALRQLDIDAITTPNFSFFSDVPRTHSLWNLARMSRMTEYLSSSGINVIPHIHAATKTDWNYWTRIFLDDEHITHIIREFQTGGRNRDVALSSIQKLADFRDKLGRELHLVAVGAGQYASILRRHFSKLTLVDSTPFIKTHKRQRLVLRPGSRPMWIRHQTAPDESLHELLRDNVIAYRAWQENRIREFSLEEKTDAEENQIPTVSTISNRQQEFSFSKSA